ncbi:MAG: hypothetical protein IH934_08165 [Nanoarchaeota archaeon]|nr:hypothetical protein [Nanoarchaeota archaeon]
MSVKTLLGLESTSLSNEEIMRQIEEAYSKKLDEVEFSSPKRKVVVKLCQVNPAGLMKWDYPAQ